VQDRKLVIVLMGLPASGKTKLGKLLEAIEFHVLPEAAEVLRSKGWVLGEKASPEFDRKVMSIELARDYRFVRSNRRVQVVETWHIGDISYALARSSPIAPHYKSKFQQVLQIFEIRCLVLHLSPYTSYMRSIQYRKPTLNSIDFLSRVQKYMAELIAEFGLNSVAIDASRKFDDVMRQAIKEVSFWSSRYA